MMLLLLASAPMTARRLLLFETKRHEHDAIGALRSLGALQLAYSDTNLEEEYGRFPALVKTGLIGEHMTRETLIPEYVISTFYAETGCWWMACDGGFTIVAVPRQRRSRLRTFAICDDQVVRIATDFNLNQPANADYGYPAGDNPRKWNSVPRPQRRTEPYPIDQLWGSSMRWAKQHGDKPGEIYWTLKPVPKVPTPPAGQKTGS